MKIEFVSYTGKWPCLCLGVLTLRIDGKEYTFGYEDGCDYSKFWASGGCCGIVDGESEVIEGRWWCSDNLPTFLKDYEEEIMDLFNENVDYGCCGGCL